MFSIRRPWWAALTLTALAVGCSTEEPATPATPSPASTPSPAPNTTPETTSKDTVKPESIQAPSPLAKPETPTKDQSAPPAVEAPKVDVPKIEAPKPEAPKADAPKGDAPKAAAVKLTDDEVAAIKKLPAAEQAAALKQAVCPVSGENLGSMDVPVKVSAEGKTFYLCCKGCKKELDADPKAVVAKLAGK